MNQSETLHGERTLAQIESDLLKADAAFADADTRLKEAERDRRAAIETINKHQTEFDKAIMQLRQRSTAGSKWRLEVDQPEGALILHTEDITEDTSSRHPKLESVSDEFDRLKTLVQVSGNNRGR